MLYDRVHVLHTVSTGTIWLKGSIVERDARELVSRLNI